MILTKDDVERITENVLMNLRLDIGHGNFTDPNTRTITLMYDGKEIDRVSFSIRQQREYEG